MYIKKIINDSNPYYKRKYPIQYGSNENNFKLEWTDKFIEYDTNICTDFYIKFNDKERYYESLFTDSTMKPLVFSFYLNDTEFIDPQGLIARPNHVYDFVETYGNRLYLKKNVLDERLPKIRITKYIPLSLGGFFFYYEVLYNFDLLNNKKNVLEIANVPVFLECCNYYQNKYSDEKSQYDLLFLSKYSILKEDEWKKYLKYLSQFIKMNITIHDSSIKKLNNIKKYDLICCTLSYYNKKFGSILMDHYNVMLSFAILVYIFKNINIGGNYVFYPSQIRFKPVADIILICKKYFYKVELYIPQIHNKYKYGGIVVICINFLGINENDKKELDYILHNLYDYDDSLVDKFNINNKEIYNKYIKDLHNHNPIPYDSSITVKYVKSFLKFQSSDEQYYFIYKFNEENYLTKYLHINNLIEFKKMEPTEREKLIPFCNQKNLMSSIFYAQKYHFEYISYHDKFLNTELEMKIINDMYGYSNPIIYLFKKHNDKNEDDKNEDDYVKIPKSYKQMYRDLNMINMLIDTRNINEWYKIKKEIRYYSPNKKADRLTSYIQKYYNTGRISQAWLKMRELIVDLNLIDPTVNTFTTFHICEAPGNFIASIMYYINTKTSIKNFVWHAQSLNPYLDLNPHLDKDKKRNSRFGDDYGLISKYSNRWLWGADNTGDITKSDNIKYYQKYINDADLVTSDCGIPKEDNPSDAIQVNNVNNVNNMNTGYNPSDAIKVNNVNNVNTGYNDQDPLIKVHFAEILTILNGLHIGKSFVAKMFMPMFEPIQISILYLLYNSFDKLYFYKGLVNTFSSEFYVIGKGFNGINDNILKKLFQIMENFDKSIDIYDAKYHKYFINQLSYIFKILFDGYKYNFDRQLYYVDNYEALTKDHLKEIQKIIKLKNIEWVEKYMELK